MSTNEHNPQTENKVAGDKSSQTSEQGRGNDGRFTRGNPGGPGNPYNRQAALLRKEIHERMTKEKMGALVDSLIDRGIKGDVAAAKLVLQYAVGKPTEAPNPDGMDLEEIGYYRREAGMMRDVKQMAKDPDPIVLLTLLRIMREAATSRVARTLRNELKRDDEERERSQASKESPESGVRSPESHASASSGEPGPSTKVRGIELPGLSREEFLALREQVRQKEDAQRQAKLAGGAGHPPSANGKLTPTANK